MITTKSPNQPLPRMAQPYKVRLPGLSVGQEIGLGDAIKRATSAMGIKPCAPCQKRAEALNRRITFSGYR